MNNLYESNDSKYTKFVNRNYGILVLVIKSVLIYLLLYIADYLFSLYNTNYKWAGLSQINIGILFTIIAVLLFEKLWVRIVFLSLILSSMLVEFIFYQYFGTFVQPIGFYQIVFNARETAEVLSDEVHMMIIPMAIIGGIFFAIVILKNTIKVHSYRNTIFGFSLLVMLFSYSVYETYTNLHSKSGKLWHKQAKKLMPLPGIHSSENYLRALNYFMIGILPKKLSSDGVEIFPTLQSPALKNISEDNNIIFIIGETLRAKQLGILGYKLDTTPKLEKVDGLIVKSVYAAGTMTKVSVSALLNRVKYPGATAQMMKQDNNLFYLAKRNDYKTFFYSWQNNSQLDILQSFIGRKYIDDYASRETLKERIKNHSDYDDNLLKALKGIDLGSGKNFIVLHERGSHATYGKQYPKSFKKFKKTYDNTVLYTDSRINEIIQYVKKQSRKPTYVIYTSDHGELLHEHGKNGHGWFFPEVYRVPFIAYVHNKSGTNILYKNIQTHFDVSNLVTSYLGYDIKIEEDKDIYVNGSDVDGLAGYLHITLDDNGTEISVKEIR